MPLTPYIELLGPDPRPILQDLRQLNIRDPRRALFSWLVALRRLGVPFSNTTSYKFAVAYELDKFHSRAKARKVEEWEDKRWRDPKGGEGRTMEPEDLDKTVKPTFGLWLFPADAFGPFEQDGEPVRGGTDRRRFINLSSFYPELAFSRSR
jgi:hypothetical protein